VVLVDVHCPVDSHRDADCNSHRHTDEQYREADLNVQLLALAEAVPEIDYRPGDAAQRLLVMLLLSSRLLLLCERLLRRPHLALLAAVHADLAGERVLRVVMLLAERCCGADLDVFLAGCETAGDVGPAVVAAVDFLEGGGRVRVEGGVDRDGFAVVVCLEVVRGDGGGEDGRVEV